MKTKFMVQILEDELKRLGLTYFNNPAEFIKQKKKTFDETRIRIHKYVEESLNNLWYHYNSKVEQDFKNDEGLTNLMYKIGDRLDTLKLINTNLGTNQCVNSIKKCLKYTTVGLMDELKLDVSEIER